MGILNYNYLIVNDLTINKLTEEALQFIPCKSAPGKYCPKPMAILPSSYIVISSDAFGLKGLLSNAFGQL